MYVTTYKADGTITSIGKVSDSFPVNREHPPDGLLYTDEIPDGRGIILQYKIQNGEYRACGDSGEDSYPLQQACDHHECIPHGKLER